MKALDALEARDHERALNLLAPFPDDASVTIWKLRVAAHVIADDPDAAVETCRTALEIWPEDEDLQRTLERSLVAQEQRLASPNGPSAERPRRLFGARAVTLAGALLIGLPFIGSPFITGLFNVAASVSDSSTLGRGEYGAEELHIALDENGRPYDVGNAEYWPDSVKLQPLMEWEVPGGRLLSMDGNWIEIGPNGLADDSPVLEFNSEALVLSSLVTTYPDPEGGEPYEGSMGIEVRRAGAQVTVWGPTEFGASTDGGVIGMVTHAALAFDQNDGEFIPHQQIQAWFDASEAVMPFDFVNGEGTDAVLFSTGGDGSFPLVRGYDANGELVAALLLSLDYPWRLMSHEGTMPPDLAAIEEQYAECMRGERDVRAYDLGDGTTRLSCEINIDELPSAEDFAADS